MTIVKNRTQCGAAAADADLLSAGFFATVCGSLLPIASLCLGETSTIQVCYREGPYTHCEI